MSDQNYFFNILTFDWNTDKGNYFGLEEIGHCQKIQQPIFPKNIENIFSRVTNGTEFIYITFTGESKGFKTFEIDLPNENQPFDKRYEKQINYSFRLIKEKSVKFGFIEENQVWKSEEMPHFGKYNLW